MPPGKAHAWALCSGQWRAVITDHEKSIEYFVTWPAVGEYQSNELGCTITWQPEIVLATLAMVEVTA